MVMSQKANAPPPQRKSEEMMNFSRKHTFPKTNIEAENRPFQKESSFPTTIFQVFLLLVLVILGSPNPQWIFSSFKGPPMVESSFIA